MRLPIYSHLDGHPSYNLLVDRVGFEPTPDALRGRYAAVTPAVYGTGRERRSRTFATGFRRRETTVIRLPETWSQKLDSNQRSSVSKTDGDGQTPLFRDVNLDAPVGIEPTYKRGRSSLPQWSDLGGRCLIRSATER